MDHDVLQFAQVAAVIVGLVGGLAAIGVAAFKAVMRRPASKESQPLNDDRLERLQQSVDAIAIEVERIAESQRFSARLMSERPERVIERQS